MKGISSVLVISGYQLSLLRLRPQDEDAERVDYNRVYKEILLSASSFLTQCWSIKYLIYSVLQQQQQHSTLFILHYLPLILFVLLSSCILRGLNPPMTSNGNGNRLVGWIHLKIDLFGVPAFISLLFAITKARASPQMAP